VDACFDLVLPGLLIGLGRIIQPRRDGRARFGYALDELTSGNVRDFPPQMLAGEHRLYTVANEVIDGYWRWLHPPAEPDWNDLDAFDDEGNVRVFPDPLDDFLRRELTDDRTWSIRFMPQCEQLDEIVNTDQAGALALLRASFTGPRLRGFVANHIAATAARR
jgi:hypothetical protein